MLKNTPNEQTLEFLAYVQEVMIDLYNKYNTIDDDGMLYSCPLDDLINDGYFFATMNSAVALDME